MVVVVSPGGGAVVVVVVVVVVSVVGRGAGAVVVDVGPGPAIWPCEGPARSSTASAAAAAHVVSLFRPRGAIRHGFDTDGEVPCRNMTT